jgi:hypothetical protein
MTTERGLAAYHGDAAPPTMSINATRRRKKTPVCWRFTTFFFITIMMGSMLGSMYREEKPSMPETSRWISSW